MARTQEAIVIRHGMRWFMVALGLFFLAVAASLAYMGIVYCLTDSPEYPVLVFCVTTIPTALCLLLVFYAFATLRKCWRVDNEGITQTGVFERTVRWREVVLFHIGKNDSYGHCEISILNTEGQVLKMDTAQLATGLVDPVTRLVEFARERVRPPASVVVAEVSDMQNRINSRVLFQAIGIPSIYVFVLNMLPVDRAPVLVRVAVGGAMGLAFYAFARWRRARRT